MAAIIQCDRCKKEISPDVSVFKVGVQETPPNVEVPAASASVVYDLCPSCDDQHRVFMAGRELAAMSEEVITRG